MLNLFSPKIRLELRSKIQLPHSMSKDLSTWSEKLTLEKTKNNLTSYINNN